MDFEARWFVAMALVLSLGFPAAGQEPPPPEGGEAQAKEPEPKFKHSKGGDAYKKGRELFDLEQYRDALAELKKARDQAKAPADKAIVETWVAAAEHGVALESYKRMVERGALRQTYFLILDASEKAKGSAVYPRYKALIDELTPKVLDVLEGFDPPLVVYSEKFGKKIVSDPAIVFRGRNCLLWNSLKDGKPSQLKIAKVPAKWTPYYALVFWIRCEKPVDLQLLAITPGRTGEEPNAMEAGFTPSSHQGWKRVLVDLDRFKKHGAASLANIESFIIQIDAKTSYKFYIDEIALVRKDASEGGGAAAADAKDAKDGKDQKQSKKKGPKTTAGKIKQTEPKKN